MILHSAIKKIFPIQGYGFIENPKGGKDIYFKCERRRAYENGNFRELHPSERSSRLKLLGKAVCCRVLLVNGNPQAEYWAILS
jgi:cold shock CspA family protein